MNWFKALNEALEYVEDHILEDIDTEEVAKIALCSKFHFLRTFGMLTGMPLSEYIRHRRLSLAAAELVQTDQKVIDLAFKYGYETPESFTKAFKKLHGISPSVARKEQANLTTIMPLSFQIVIKGDERMDYHIQKRDAFKIVGVSKRISTVNDENFTTVPKFWNEVMRDGTLKKLCGVSETTLGVCYDVDREQEHFSYLIAVEADGIHDLENQVLLEVPEMTWAVFKSVGKMPDAMQNIWHKIFHEWFPATNYEHADAPELEVYPAGDAQSEDYVCEIWIPIKEK